MKTPRAMFKEQGCGQTLHDGELGMVLRGAALVFALMAPGTVLAEGAEADDSEFIPARFDYSLPLTLDRRGHYFLAQNPDSNTPGLRQADSSTPGTHSSEPEISGKTLAGKSELIPAAEIVGFNLLLNRFNYHFIDKAVYGSTLQSVRDNLSGKWVVDTDPFAVNQFMHPYQGSVYFGLARSSGNDYWESLGYTFGGSLLWEIAGETGAPSINDLVTTGFAGTFLGEPLFRMASLLLEEGGENPGFWRELGAAAISPSLGFNRLAFGDRFRSVFDSRHPATYSYIRLGWNRVDDVFDEAVSQKVKRDAASADFHMSYGLPGKPGYRYTRPFDYFDFEFSANTANTFENIMSRGLLLGKEYAVGDGYRGIWGLYGSYDYISPQIFRVSSTALSLGTTAQWWLSKSVALQGTALVGLGYGAAGTIHGSGERDYHYGATPQALLALRLMFGKRADLDLTARSYYVSDVASTEDNGSERIFRADAAFTVRVRGPHAITLKYNDSRRNARYPGLADTQQTVKTLSLLYTYYFGGDKSGAVEWRAADRLGVAQIGDPAQ
ncbi:MAG: DUF3943 domain-containing protein [Gallionellaceae bacterium]|nr:DUF3943 domain-containing protein [Gallionellaceae bacterium]